MRPVAFAVPVALLSLVTACSTSSQPVDRTTAVPTPTTSESSSSPSESSSSPSESASSPSESSSSPSGSSSGAAATKLTGELGENNAFTITLVDDKGAPVTTLKAGTYEIKVKDRSAIHNFHLTGDGVEQTTTVPEIKEVTWTVTFKAGTYTYVCDPHPTNMKKTFTVT